MMAYEIWIDLWNFWHRYSSEPEYLTNNSTFSVHSACPAGDISVLYAKRICSFLIFLAGKFEREVKGSEYDATAGVMQDMKSSQHFLGCYAPKEFMSTRTQA